MAGDMFPRVSGVGQHVSNVRRIVVPLDTQLTGQSPTTSAGALGTIRLPFKCKSFRFAASSGVAAGAVFAAIGTPDALGGNPSFSAAGLKDVLDVVLCPFVHVEDGVTDLSIYSAAAYAGESLVIYAFRDADVRPNATATLTLANPLPVADASVTPAAATVAQSVAAVTDASSVALAANAARKGGSISNVGSNACALRFIAGAAVYATDYPLAVGATIDLRQANLVIRALDIKAICAAGLTTTLAIVELT